MSRDFLEFAEIGKEPQRSPSTSELALLLQLGMTNIIKNSKAEYINAAKPESGVMEITTLHFGDPENFEDIIGQEASKVVCTSLVDGVEFHITICKCPIKDPNGDDQFPDLYP